MSTADLKSDKRGAVSALHRLNVTGLDDAAPAVAKPPLERPASTQQRRINWVNTTIVLGFHAFLPLLFVPYLFSWYGLLWLPVGNYLFCSMGIGAGYHRLLTHRGYQCPRWLEYTLATLGVCCIQDSPARWVATHRIHHNNSDEQPDPHSPLVTFFWGHLGWLFIENSELNKLSTFEKYSKDLIQQPFYRWFERRRNTVWVLLAHAAIITGLGAIYGAVRYEETAAITQCAAQWFFWGVVMRVIYTWHVTWGVNSLAHASGYRNYETLDNSRNNWIIGLATNGEGWHNNHHADPRSARHGHRWWELDITYATICLWEKVGLAWNIVGPCRKTMKQPDVPQEAEAA